VPGRELNGAGKPRQPGRYSLLSEAADHAREIEIDRSIVGPLRVPAELHRLTIRDSIVDAPEIPAHPPAPAPRRVAIAQDDGALTPGPACHVEGSTILGDVYVRALTHASNSVFYGTARAERASEGCIRFSWTPQGSETPRRYRCQPDEALREAEGDAAAAARVLETLRPIFTSTRYGEAAYGQLDLDAPAAIRAGADDGSEMGAFSFLKQPQREANLRIRLTEYLPFGLEAGLIYVT
jgi:hypothetical protein